MPDARASQVVAEVLASATADARASQVVVEALGQGSDQARASQIVAEVLGTVQPYNVLCGPIPIFPTLPVGFPFKWRPNLKTTIGASQVSKREARWSNQAIALHEFELVFENLRDRTQNQTPYAPFAALTDYMQLCQFWLSMNGQGGVFYFELPWDSSRTDQVIGTGDGVATEFVAKRTFGLTGASLTEPVGGIKSITNLKLNGVVQSPLDYSYLGNLVFLSSAPGAGVVVTMSFDFYYLCRFIQDNQDFEEFAKDRWQVTGLKFRSVYAPL